MATVRPQVLTQWADDFVGFAAKLDILQDDGARVKLRPNPVQAAFEAHRTGRDIILKPRQIGFTTWELARDVWFFLTRPGARVTVLCKTEDKAKAVKELTGKLRVMFEGLIASGIRIEVQNDATDTWMYGDAILRIVECGGTSAAAKGVGRGGTVQRLHITELAIFQYAQETLTAILPCVPDVSQGTEITIESTANGAAGVFFERWNAAKAGRGEFCPYFVRWTDHPKYQAQLSYGERVDPITERERQLKADGATVAQLKWYRLHVEDAGQELTDQEFPSNEETCWLVPGRIFFDKAKVDGLFAHCREPIAVERGGALRVYARPSAERAYVIVADTSSGTAEDPSAACVYDRASGEHVATLHRHYTPWQLADELEALGRTYNTATLVVERNNHGGSVLDSLANGNPAVERLPYPRIYDGEDGKPGWNTTATTRPAALDSLEAAVRDGSFKTPDRCVIAEMLTFVVHPKTFKPQALPGAHDELVIVAAIAHDVLRRSIATVRLPTKPVAAAYRFAGGGRGF